jgi:hypothetical protein
VSTRKDEQAVFQVVEAILVAVLIASTLVFFALVQKPTPAPTSPGLDLARIAGDALAILQGDDPGGTTDELQDAIEVMIPSATTTQKSTLRAQVNATLPDGLRFLVRAVSDEGSVLVYGPTDPDPANPPEPRNAQGSATYVLDTTAATDYLVMVELVVWNAF